MFQENAASPMNRAELRSALEACLQLSPQSSFHERSPIQARSRVREAVNRPRKEMQTTTIDITTTTTTTTQRPASPRVHAFYYPWYGNPEHDGKYLHWDHERIPHWTKSIADRYSTEAHSPPEDIAASFYPQLGPYSSRDKDVIEAHMQQLKAAGVGVLVMTWYPPGMIDDNGGTRRDESPDSAFDALVPTLLEAAHEYDLKLTFHIEPYEGRTAISVARDLKYLIKSYGHHPALFRCTAQGDYDAEQSSPLLPFIYVYDSYHIPDQDWQSVLLPGGRYSIRGEEGADALVAGLLVEKKHMNRLVESGFDAVYTYFASTGFSYGSTVQNWRWMHMTLQLSIKRSGHGGSMIFVPCVGPGYDDESVRPWNSQNTKSRARGRYYKDMCDAALNLRPTFVGITSFNEWHEGTQIEAAVSRQGYKDYGSDPEKYLKMTRKFAQTLDPKSFE